MSLVSLDAERYAWLESKWREIGIVRTAKLLGSSTVTIDNAISSIGVRHQTLARICKAIDAVRAKEKK